MRKAIVILLMIFICGCGVINSPYALRAAADAQIEATYAARSNQLLLATLNVEETSSAIRMEKERFEVYAQATKAAFGFEQTRAAATAQAAQSATAYPLTATPLAATQTALIHEVERSERRAFWGQFTDPIIVLMPTLLLFILLGLLLVGSVAAFRRLLPILETRGRTFSRGQHDSPLFVFDADQHSIIIDPDRNFGPALRLGPGSIESSGIAPSLDLQERVTARDQAIDLARSMPRSRYQEVIERVDQTPQLPAPKIEIIEPQAVAGWVSEVEHKLLVDGEVHL